MDGDGVQDSVAWTDPADSDAFLWLDIVPNGEVDSGVELFGNATKMPGGDSAPNGFVALWFYDLPELGGNGDGEITSADAIWPSLRLWVDINHDGLSTQDEILAVDSSGILEIPLSYKSMGRRDGNGNFIRYCGFFEYEDANGKVRKSKICDIFFAQ